MTHTITISIEVPAGTAISIAGVEGATLISTERTRDPVEEYWTDYLSDNGRKVFATAARIEDVRGAGYTFEDIARILDIDYESAKSYHRNAGRTAARWEREKGVPAPIRLEFDGDYGPLPGVSGLRTHYALPPGVAEKIIAFA